MWKLNNTLPNHQLIKGEITRIISKYFEMNENERTTCQNLSNAAINSAQRKLIDVKVLAKR